jgi:hypothetical protein
VAVVDHERSRKVSRLEVLASIRLLEDEVRRLTEISTISFEQTSLVAADVPRLELGPELWVRSFDPSGTLLNLVAWERK